MLVYALSTAKMIQYRAGHVWLAITSTHIDTCCILELLVIDCA